MSDQIKEISHFFKFSELRNSIKEHAPESQKKKVSDFCPTRWVEKVRGLDDIEDLFAPIVFCPEEMSLNIGRVCNQDTSAKATLFYKVMTSSDFLSSLVITKSILDLTLPVTQLLQFPAIDVADATHLIVSLKSLICCKRNAVDTFHKNATVIALKLLVRYVLRSANQEHLSWNRMVIIFHQNQFLIISKM